MPAAVDAKMVTADLDVIVGPWNPRKKSGTHNMLFFHRGRFRSNTLGNLNAYGPGANAVKAQQNIDMPAHSYTQFKGGQVLTLGHTYHITHIYDAASKIVTFIMSENGHVLKQGAFPATAKGKVVTVASTGLVAEFGNYDWQALPEVGSIGWSFANFRVVIQPLERYRFQPSRGGLEPAPVRTLRAAAGSLRYSGTSLGTLGNRSNLSPYFFAKGCAVRLSALPYGCYNLSQLEDSSRRRRKVR